MNSLKSLLKTICYSTLALCPALILADEPSRSRSEKKSESKEFYLIGVSSYPVNSSLRTHLPIVPKEQGLQIRQIVDDGVAAKVLEVHDILIQANDTPLKSIRDFYDVIQKAGKTQTQIQATIIRAGKQISVTIPAPKKVDRHHRSPFSNDHHRRKPRFGPPDHHGRHKKHDSFDMTRIPGHILDMRFPKKLSTLRSSFRTEDGFFVVVEQVGEKMSIFVVSKDGKRWDAARDEIDSLPESVQSEIQLRLKDFPDHNGKSTENNLASDSNVRVEKLENQINQMQNQLESLTKLIESMNKKMSESK